MSCESTLEKLKENKEIIDVFFENESKTRIIAIVDFITSIQSLPKEMDGIPVLFRISSKNE